MNKYKFNGKEKIVAGITLRQIVCVTAFLSVSVGDVGGWLESESNLSQSGNAWVSGNARVSGNAKATSKVLTISSNHYHVTITDNHIKIGCKQLTIKQWSKISRKKLIEMDGEVSADLWEKSKDFILMLAEDR